MKKSVVVVIDGKEVDFYSLPEQTRKELVHELNKRACERAGYREVTAPAKTA